MSYIEVFEILTQHISDLMHEADMLSGQVKDRKWARAKSYTRSLRTKLIRIDAMIDTCDLVDRERPPTTP